MHTTTLMLFSLLACGQKDSDTSSPDESETQEPQDTGDTQNVDETQDTGEVPSSQETGDTDSETVPDRAGEEGVNSSESPPTGSCRENSASIQTGDTTYNFSTFYWDFDETGESTKIFFTGYQVGMEVDICETQSFFDYAQVNLIVTPILSELPQTVALGVNDYHQNVSGTMVFVEDVNSPTPVMYPSLEGETTLNSFIEGEKSKISELNIGSLGYDLSGGDMSSFEEVNYQFSGGFDLIGCWCPGMAEAYDIGPN